METMEAKVERQKPQDRDSQSDPTPFSRRGFLKTGAALGTAMCIPPALGNVLAGQTAIPKQHSANQSLITQRRTLGSGKNSLEVTALGFGCMGMNYHRGLHPDRSAMIKLLRQAAELGVTFLRHRRNLWSIYQ